MIFRAETDCRCLVDSLRRIVIDGVAAVYAWSLLPHRLDLLIRTGPTPLSLLMRRLLTGHAVRFNRRYQRSGHVFKNRFKSILVIDETYLLPLVRSIHLNPLRAGVLSTLDELDSYPWTGHRSLVSDGGPSWQSVAAVLSCYGTDLVAARMAYRRFMAAGIGRSDHDLNGGGFVRRRNRWGVVTELNRAREAWAPAERCLARPSTLSNLDADLFIVPPVRGRQAAGIDPSVLVDRVMQRLGVTAAAVAGASRHRSVATVRALLSDLLVRRYGLSFNETARALGISKWRVRRAAQRFEVSRVLSAVLDVLVEVEGSSTLSDLAVRSDPTRPPEVSGVREESGPSAEGFGLQAGPAEGSVTQSTPTAGLTAERRP